MWITQRILTKFMKLSCIFFLKDREARANISLGNFPASACATNGRQRNLNRFVITRLEIRILPQNNGGGIITITVANYLHCFYSTMHRTWIHFKLLYIWLHNSFRVNAIMPVYYELNKYINSYDMRKNSCLRIHIMYTFPSKCYSMK